MSGILLRPARPRTLATARNAIALASITLRLATRDTRAFVFSFLFPLVFVFLYGMMATNEGPAEVRDLAARVLALTILVGSFFGQGLALAMQRERGMLRRYRLTPLGASGVLSGTAVAGLALVFLTLTVQLAIWRLAFGQPDHLAWGRFLMAALVAAISMTGMGLVVAAIASTVQEAQILFQVTFLGSLLLANITIPLEMLPSFLQRLSAFLPATHAFTVIQRALVGNTPWRADIIPLAALTLMAASSFYVAARLFRWERDDPLPRRAKWAALLGVLPVLLYGLALNALMPLEGPAADPPAASAHPASPAAP